MRRGLALVRGGGLVLILAWLAVALLAARDTSLIGSLWFLPAVGLLGGTIANTSGTGGGVVFVPVFNALREWQIMALSPLSVTAASMAIQCFGMTMGALRWSERLVAQPPGSPSVRRRDFARIAIGVIALSVPTMLVTQRVVAIDRHEVLLAFKSFSIMLGSVLLLAAWTYDRKRAERHELAPIDLAIVLALAVPGGFVTALFSVGVGEMVALWLFIRHYPILLCSGVACVISAVNVIAGLPWHIDHGTVPWAVVLLAAPGAVLGGFVARPLALWLGPLRLKTAGGGWIVASSLYLLWLNRG